MHFVKLRWLNSFSRQLMAAVAGGVLFGALLLIAGLFAMSFFQGSLFSEIGVSEYVESIAEQLQFDATGRPIAVGPPQMSWLYDSLGTEATYRVLDDKGAVVLSSEPGAPALTGTGKAAVLDFDNFTFERQRPRHAGSDGAHAHAGRTWYVQFATSERLSDMLRAYVGAPLASRSVAILCLGALIMYCCVMRFTLRAILKPLNEASAIAAKITPRNLGTRLQATGVPEELRSARGELQRGARSPGAQLPPATGIPGIRCA